MKLIIEEERYKLLHGDAEQMLTYVKSAEADCIFTSPDPIRSDEEYNKILLILGKLSDRILNPMGSIWVHMEDAFNEQGSLMRWPAKFSSEMPQKYNWVLRGERIWHAPVGGRNFYNEGKVIDNNRLILDHSYCFHFTKARYGYYNTFEDFGGQPCSIFTEKQRELGPNEFPSAFSMELVKQCLLMSCPRDGTVLDPFSGTGTTGVVALAMGYNFIGIEKDAAKIPRIQQRLKVIINE